MSAEQSLKNSYTIVGIILLLEGLSFLIYPYMTTQLLQLSPIQTAQAEQYTRLLGFAIAILGYYYTVAGIYTIIGFYRASVIGRFAVLPTLIAMVYFGPVEMPFLLIGIQDFITAIWSYKCLKAYDEQQAKNKK